MYRRVLLAATALPLLAQAGCTQEDAVGLVLVVVQAVLASLIPTLVNALVGGTGVALMI